MKPVMPINKAIELLKAPSLTEQDRRELIFTLIDYRGVMSDALEVVSSKCNEVLEFMDENDLKDSEDDTLTQCEQDSWIGLEAVLGGEYPVPNWYRELWIDSQPTEGENE